MAIGGLFEISRKSLATYQRALSVTSNNIANAQNENYSRQKTNLQAETPEYINGFEIGNGVSITDVNRVRNEILDRQIRKYNEYRENTNSRNTTLSSVESLFTEPSDLGLSNLIESFFNTWEELSMDPSSIPLRNDVINSAEQMSNKIYSIYEGLSTIRTDLNSEAEDNVETLNRYLTELHEVNKQIYQAYISETSANTLLDKRDELLKEISSLVNVNTTINTDNTVSLSIGGVHVVDKTTLTELSVEETASGNYTKLSIIANGDTTLSVRGGKLYGIIDNFNNVIPDYMDKIDTLANSIMQKVNSIHSTMFTIDSAPETGINFFSDYSAGSLKINFDILQDPRKIAVSSDGSEGNNEGALAIADLADSDSINGQTFLEAYSDLVNQISNAKSLNEQQTSTFDLVLQQLNSQFNEESGVSVDEEMVNVLTYQRSYDAAAKLIKVADEILQTLLQMV